MSSHDKLSQENKDKHFRHELGLKDSYARAGSYTQLYKDNFDAIFRKKDKEPVKKD